MDLNIQHDPHARQFFCTVDALRCVIDYELNGTIMSITHTGVPAALEGRGIAGQLTRYALETAKKQHWTVRPLCSYAAVYIRRHPEYADLLA
ncbi:MAG TPA: GNAT family N-acetyltransferase [Alcaligenes sp.]|nr:GNAT family N-acetyltransferase [Alcaligenes sp.]HRL26883.1 GNAT family N-acetyltransferase [Alcaligenes sp.]